jgi:hypothetical protein
MHPQSDGQIQNELDEQASRRRMREERRQKRLKHRAEVEKRELKKKVSTHPD